MKKDTDIWKNLEKEDGGENHARFGTGSELTAPRGL